MEVWSHHFFSFFRRPETPEGDSVFWPEKVEHVNTFEDPSDNENQRPLTPISCDRFAFGIGSNQIPPTAEKRKLFRRLIYRGLPSITEASEEPEPTPRYLFHIII